MIIYRRNLFLVLILTAVAGCAGSKPTHWGHFHGNLPSQGLQAVAGVVPQAEDGADRGREEIDLLLQPALQGCRAEGHGGAVARRISWSAGFGSWAPWCR